MSKNILVFSDGTGQAGGLTPDETRSNIYKMYRATRCAPDSNINANEQISFYDPGLGSQSLQGGFFSRVWRQIYNLVSQATGLGITKNIIDCYAWLIRVYEPGDHIFLFGFSRGAYTVRCVSGVLSLCGIPMHMPDGQLLRRDIGGSTKIAKEAVKNVYQYVSSPKDIAYLEQRKELAANFRQNYGCDNKGEPNVVPFFIGVFDTVASLGSYILFAILFGISLLPLVGVSFLLSLFLFSFKSIFFILGIISVLIAGICYVVSHVKIAHGLTKYTWWERWHFTSPKMKFYDLHLDNKIWYARHALSIDENRKDFDRVIWGSVKNKGPDRPEGSPEWLQQVWFAGNHADIGGGYDENESRLSDISLEWMVNAAINLPDNNTATGSGIKIDARYMQLNPDPFGPQHDECESGYWRKGIREIDPLAPLHESVYKRFDAPNGVPHFYTRQPYRPINLLNHKKLSEYYKKDQEAN